MLKLTIYNRKLQVFIIGCVVTIIYLILIFVYIDEQDEGQAPIPKPSYNYEDVSKFIFGNSDDKRDEQVMPGLNETGLPFDIVPNTVHYILFALNEIRFAHFLSMLSVFKNQKPKLIYIHCDCHRLTGQYWDRVVMVSNKTSIPIVLREIVKPTQIYGQKLSTENLNWHASDITRLRVLSQFGGIYLDTDVYVVRPFNDFFKYELTLDWDKNPNGTLGPRFLELQTIIAHKNARFLRLWLKSYHFYNGRLWVFNSEELPTEAILKPRPDLIHRVYGQFGAWGETMCPILYKKYYPQWRTQYYAIHLLMRGNEISMKNWCFRGNVPNITKFDEHNIKTLKTTFGEMARDVLRFEYQLIVGNV